MSSFQEPPRQRRIAITGVGLVTPLGVGRELTWQGLLSGCRAVQWLDKTGLEEFQPRFPGEPRLFGARVPLDVPAGDRLVTFARLAAREAVEHAQLSPAALRDAICVIGTSKIDLQRVDHLWTSPASGEQPGDFLQALFPSSAATAVALDLGCEGGALCPVAACATGLLSIIQAADLIRSGACEVALGGAADSSLHRGVLASYRRLGVLAKPGEDPSTSCRPFDADRTGFAVGEGAGVLVLEDWDFAQSRGAPILAEWEIGMVASESVDLMHINPDGNSLIHLISAIVDRTGCLLDDISAVSLHGTGTRLNDLCESAAIRAAFSGRQQPIDLFAIKGAIGHLMGAAGAVETAACVLGLARGVIPPTVNHQNWGEGIDGVADRLMMASGDSPDRIMKISLGFGGTLAVAVLKSIEKATDDIPDQCVSDF